MSAPRLRAWLWLGGVALAGCREPRPDAAVAATKLERDLTMPAVAAPVDTAAKRQDDEWQRCLYVYHDQVDAKVRECLVIQYRWEPKVAERQISLFVDSLKRFADSLERVRDSLAIERKRRADSTYLATHRERLDGPDVPLPDHWYGAWVADTRTGAYYHGCCTAARRIPVEARQVYAYESDAVADKRWPTRHVGRRPNDQAPE